MRTVVCFSLGLLLSGCSLYESAGRKFLENNAYQYAGVSAQAELVGCGHQLPTSTSWTKLDKDEEAVVYASEGENFDLRIQTRADESYGCDFHFASAQELYQKSASAKSLTLEHLNEEQLR